VVPKHVAAHLARNHSRTTKRDQTDIQQYVDGLEDIAYDVSGVIFLGPEDPPYDMIAVQYDSLRCSATEEDGQRCRRVMRTTRMIKAHCEAAHGWRNEQRHRGNVKQKKAQPPNRMWDEG
jgi:hypothetical protein